MRFVKYKRKSGVVQIAKFDHYDKLAWQCMIESAMSSNQITLISFGTGEWEDEINE
jgi:hypothetical protein